MVVYLDHAATTPLRPEAREEWLRASQTIGNPSSIHGAGQSARRILEDARERLAAALGCDPIEVVLTSGGTESINLAIRGLWAARAMPHAARILSSAGEHHATLDTLAALEREGATVDLVGIDEDGRLDADAWTQACAGAGAALATLLAASSEVGAVQPLPQAIGTAAAAGIPLHLDAVGTFGHIPLSFRRLREDANAPRGAGLVAMSVAAHKIGGPVGAGALVVARDASLRPLMHGGGQQRGLRPGTQDAAGAAAFAVAAELAVAEQAAEAARLAALRDRLEAGIRAAVPAARVSAAGAERLPGHLHVVFPGAQGDSLLVLLDAAGIAVSTGSACQAGVPEPSHVLLAMGRDAADASCALRFTLGRTSGEADVDAVLAVLPAAYERARRAGLSSRTVARPGERPSPSIGS